MEEYIIWNMEGFTLYMKYKRITFTWMEYMDNGKTDRVFIKTLRLKTTLVSKILGEINNTSQLPGLNGTLHSLFCPL